MRVMTHLVLWAVGLAEAESQTTEAERACLVRWATGRRRVVEIGVWHGATSRRLRAAMAADGVLIAVDPYPSGRLGFSAQRFIALREVGRVPNGSVRWIRRTGAGAAATYGQSDGAPVDFLFIDGDHRYETVRADWEAWTPFVRRDGVVALHDSRAIPDRDIANAGSAVFTRTVVLEDKGFDLVDTADSLTVVRRR